MELDMTLQSLTDMSGWKGTCYDTGPACPSSAAARQLAALWPLPLLAFPAVCFQLCFEWLVERVASLASLALPHQPQPDVAFLTMNVCCSGRHGAELS